LLLGAIENLWENAPTACKNITLFVYLWCAAHDAHHTWHGDRGGPCHFLHPLTFLDRDKFVAKISKFDGLGGLYYHFCPDKHVITFIGAICCPCGAKTQYNKHNTGMAALRADLPVIMMHKLQKDFCGWCTG